MQLRWQNLKFAQINKLSSKTRSSHRIAANSSTYKKSHYMFYSKTKSSRRLAAYHENQREFQARIALMRATTAGPWVTMLSSDNTTRQQQTAGVMRRSATTRQEQTTRQQDNQTTTSNDDSKTTRQQDKDRHTRKR